jgi:hypothetical protein
MKFPSLLRFAIAVAAVLLCMGAAAQGKISIRNDANRLIVDWGGTPIPQAGGWDDLTMQLWGGTTFGSLTLQTSFVGAAIGNPAFADGFIAATDFQLVGVPPGTAFLQLRFFDTATSGRLRIGSTDEFSVTAGSFAYNSIVGSTSTWAARNVYIILPEPSSMALTALGVACLLMFRRRSD